MGQRPEVRIGTSGYVYPHWRKGVFYPLGLPASQELAYYAARFRTVEFNNPFYGRTGSGAHRVGHGGVHLLQQ
jgi:uncharacterized protein YecE (DUF72 family)